MVIEVRKPTDKEKQFMAAQPVWSSDVKTFPWQYDEKETCLIIEGEVTVTTDSQTISFGAGDYVIFPKGLRCMWQVKKNVRKYYSYG
ncbi:MAG: cupin domain-containing protein [bacterium]|nr:cupin domain-containing protein [bacterium]